MAFVWTRNYKISLLLGIIMILILISQGILKFIGNVNILDLRLYYDSETAFDILNNQNEKSLKYYKFISILDMFFVISYTIFAIYFIVNVLKYNILFCFIALITMILDYIETISTLIYLFTSQNNSDFVSKMGIVTLLKWIFFAFNIILIVILAMHKYFIVKTKISELHMQQSVFDSNNFKGIDRKETLNEMVVY